MNRTSRTVPAAVVFAALVVAMAAAQVVAVPVLDPQGWRTDPRNRHRSPWGTVAVRALTARDGTPLTGVLDADELALVRLVLGEADDVGRGHGWFTRRRDLGPLATSIDTGVQEAAEAAVAPHDAVAVAVDVRTGALLAVAAAGAAEPTTSAPPGSIWKLPLYGAALDAGLVEADSTFPVETAFAGVRNAGGRRCGGALLTVLARSCNAAAERVGALLGPDGLAAAAATWGFADTGSAGPLAQAFTAPEAGTRAFASAVIGQYDTRVDAVWAAEMAAAVAGGGIRHAPTALVGDPGGHRVLTARTAEVLLDAMRLAVADGTATRAAVAGVGVAAKTGTAQSGLGHDHGWTVAVAPANAPTIALAVLVLGGPGASRSGGRDAAPLVAAIISATELTEDR